MGGGARGPPSAHGLIVSEKVCNITIQTEEIQLQQEQAKAHRAYQRPVPKFNTKNDIEWLHERTEHLDIFLFPPITQWCSISDVLFTGGRGVSDFSVLKYY